MVKKNEVLKWKSKKLFLTLTWNVKKKSYIEKFHIFILNPSWLWPFVGEIGMDPFVSLCEYAECYYNKLE
jgi:hypothetical protein